MLGGCCEDAGEEWMEAEIAVVAAPPVQGALASGADRPMTTVVMRPARKSDSRIVAELFEIASDGVASYVWSMLQADQPDLPLLEIGRRRYEREGTPFSYQNCLLAEQDGEARGMMHAYRVDAPTEAGPGDQPVDPVLKPYSELEAPGSLYIAGMAVLPGYRGQGLGTRFLEAARERARGLGLPELSLLCFAGNTGARRLYERTGFVVIDWRPVMPHPMIRHTGDVLLMLAPV
jgi:GNAT superfamily N-acetyltransferase